MTPASEGSYKRVYDLLLVVVATGAATWLWICFCRSPQMPWNDIRLAPSFLLAEGLSVYPPPWEGAVTTWIYGPLPVLLLFPATLAANAASALLIGSGINLSVTVGTLALVCMLWPGSASIRGRLVAVATCLAIWPSATFQYIQADNFAVAFGLLSNLLLYRSGNNLRRKEAWLVAILATAGIFCKQTAIVLVLAQIIWIGWTAGVRAGILHGLRTLTCGAALLSGTIAFFGGEGVWFNLIELPSRIPFTNHTVLRLKEILPYTIVHLFIPLVALLKFRRYIQRPTCPLLLPSLCWLCALPAGLISIMKYGGSINSLHGLLYILPPFLVTLLSQESHALARLRILVPSIALITLSARLLLAHEHPWLPAIAHIQQADTIANQLRGHVWFPWSPIITYYSEGRIYHSEDGIAVRSLAQRPMYRAQAYNHLPPDWDVTAMPKAGHADWNIAVNLHPEGTDVIETDHWKLYSWVRKPDQAP